MSGLIWSALGQSIGNAASTVGNYMARDAELDERREDRRREREEDAKRQAERDSLYRRTADQQGAVRTGGGSSGPRELTDDEQSAMAGMTRPEYDAYWGSVKTGDKSAFKRETTRYSRLQDDTAGPNDEFSDATSRRDAMLVEEKIKDYPPGFEAEYQAKVAKLAEIRKISVYNKDYKDVTQGERTKQEITRSDQAIANPAAAGIIGQGMAAGEGKELVGGDSNVTRNKFTGATSTTEVGQSVISENRAQAGQAAAAGRLSDAKAGGDDPDAVNAKTADLQRKVTSARARLALELGVPDNEVNDKLKTLRNSPDPKAAQTLEKLKTLTDRYTGALDAMDSWAPGKSKPKEKPANAGGGADENKPPAISSVQGAPAGSVIGAKTEKGWEVKDKNGNLLGYTRK